MLDEFPKQVGAMLAAVLTFGPVEAVADSCHSNCDSRYYFCMQGSGVDERGCSTQQTICYMSCRSEALRWSRLVRQFGGLAKVDRVRFYAAICSVISCVS